MSRWLLVPAEAGATSATAVLDQIHAGDYLGTAVLDRNGDVADTLRPGPGDGVSPPDARVSVAESGVSTATLSILVDL